MDKRISETLTEVMALILKVNALNRNTCIFHFHGHGPAISVRVYEKKWSEHGESVYNQLIPFMEDDESEVLKTLDRLLDLKYYLESLEPAKVNNWRAKIDAEVLEVICGAIEHSSQECDTAFIHFFGHIPSIDVLVHKNGWTSPEDDDFRRYIELDAESFAELGHILQGLREMKDEVLNDE